MTSTDRPKNFIPPTLTPTKKGQSIIWRPPNTGGLGVSAHQVSEPYFKTRPQNLSSQKPSFATRCYA